MSCAQYFANNISINVRIITMGILMGVAQFVVITNTKLNIIKVHHMYLNIKISALTKLSKA